MGSKFPAAKGSGNSDSRQRGIYYIGRLEFFIYFLVFDLKGTLNLMALRVALKRVTMASAKSGGATAFQTSPAKGAAMSLAAAQATEPTPHPSDRYVSASPFVTSHSALKSPYATHNFPR